MAESSGTVDDNITTMELGDGNHIEKTLDGKGNSIHINQDFHERAENMV